MSNDFIPFAVGGSANVITQSAYAALTSITQNGFQSGIAQSNQLNKVWRQSSIMSAVLAQFIVDQSGQNAVDDGTTATLEANLISAVRNAAKQTVILTDTGVANAYTATNTPALTVLPGTGYTQRVNIAHANTGASTYTPDGLTAKPIYGLGLQPLQGGELPVGVVVLMYLVQAGVNSGNGAWIIIESLGGAQQIPPATQSQHALQLGQATGRWISRVIYSTAGTFSETPPAGATLALYDVVGGGGGGGGGQGTTAGNIAAGAGGGAGGRAIKRFANPTTQTVTVGAGGANGGPSTSGGAGGTSSVGAICSATGGGGGTLGSSGSGGTGPGALGGTGTGGDINVRGQNGFGPFGIGSIPIVKSGMGGSGPYGSGGQEQTTYATGGNAVGNGAGGAGGACPPSNGAGASGGAGAAGIVVIDYFS
jgi:hypothetical protein